MRKVMMGTVFLMVILLGTMGEARAQASAFLWVRQAGGVDNDAGYGIAADGQGNSIVTGRFTGSAVFGPGVDPIKSVGGFDLFVAKYDAKGSLAWVRQAGGTGDEEGRAIAADGMGNVIITGRFNSTPDNPCMFGTNNLVSAGGSTDPDVFVVKYGPNGDLAWVRQAGGTGEDQGFGIATDGVGNIFVTGRFRGQTGDPAIFGSYELVSSGGSADIFVAKYDAMGSLEWVQRAGGAGHDEGLSIATDSSGSCYVTGRFYGQADFGATSLTSSGGDGDVFIAKYDGRGNLVWAKKAGGPLSDCGNGIAVDAYGNISLTGRFQGAASFDASTLNSAGGDDVFIATYDPQGGLKWARRAGGRGDDQGKAVASDRFGNVILTGSYYGSANFDSREIISSSPANRDVFVARYNKDGGLIWVVRSGGSADDSGDGIAMDLAGNSHVVGSFQGQADFGPMVKFVSAGGNDIFVIMVGGAVGDVNGDGRIGLEEAIYILQILSKTGPL